MLQLLISAYLGKLEFIEEEKKDQFLDFLTMEEATVKKNGLSPLSGAGPRCTFSKARHCIGKY